MSNVCVTSLYLNLLGICSFLSGLLKFFLPFLYSGSLPEVHKIYFPSVLLQTLTSLLFSLYILPSVFLLTCLIDIRILLQPIHRQNHIGRIFLLRGITAFLRHLPERSHWFTLSATVSAMVDISPGLHNTFSILACVVLLCK